MSSDSSIVEYQGLFGSISRAVQFALPVALVCLVALGLSGCKDVLSTDDPKNIDAAEGSKYVTTDTTNLQTVSAAIGLNVDFPVQLNGTSKDTSLVEVVEIKIYGPDESMFTIVVMPPLPFRLPPMAGWGVPVRFTPTRLGNALAYLAFTVSTPSGKFVLVDTLRGIGTGSAAAGMNISATNLQFGHVRPSSIGEYWVRQHVTLTNSGHVPITFFVDSIGGILNPQSFAVDNSAFAIDVTADHDFSSQRTLTLLPSGTILIAVKFLPQSTGTFTGSITIVDTSRTLSVLLSVTGAGDDFGYPHLATVNVPPVPHGTSIDTSIWVKNTLPFPLTLIYAAEPPANRQGIITPRVDYSTSQLILPVGDSMQLRFTIKTAQAGPINDQLEIHFKEGSTYQYPVLGSSL